MNKCANCGDTGIVYKGTRAEQQCLMPACRAKDILADCDLSILSDLMESDPDAADTCDTCGGSREVYHQTEDESWYTGCPEQWHALKPCYYIGWAPDTDAGLWGGTVTLDGNDFRSIEDAEAWVVANEFALRRNYGSDEQFVALLPVQGEGDVLPRCENPQHHGCTSAYAGPDCYDLDDEEVGQ